MFFVFKKKSKIRGFSLLETVIYAAITGASLVVVVLILNNMFLTFRSLRAQSEVLNNNEAVLRTIINEVKQSDKIYLPTSSSSQLSLRTSVNLPTDETYTYIDFYLDNGKIYVKREGQTTQPLTTDRVFVSGLSFQYLPASSPYSVSVSVSARPNIAALQEALDTTVTLSGTGNIRNR